MRTQTMTHIMTHIMTKKRLRSNASRGILQIPLLLAILLFSGIGMGVSGYLKQWRILVEHQLRLNRCVGEGALQLRKTLQSLQDSNEVIRELRSRLFKLERESSWVA